MSDSCEKCENLDFIQFDTKTFISEVHKRPAIWDFTNEDYSKKDAKRKAWEELVDLFWYKNTTYKEKYELGQYLQKKWKSIRDSYAREQRRVKKLECGEYCNRKSSYVYTKQLSFLNTGALPVTSTTTTTTAAASTTTATGSSKQEIGNSIAVKDKHGCHHKQEEIKNRGNKRKFNSEDELFSTLISTLESREEREKQSETDEDHLFLMSLHSSLKRVPVSQKLLVRIELMKILHRNLESVADHTSQQSHWNNVHSETSPHPLHQVTIVSPSPSQLYQNESDSETEQKPVFSPIESVDSQQSDDS